VLHQNKDQDSEQYPTLPISQKSRPCIKESSKNTKQYFRKLIFRKHYLQTMRTVLTSKDDPHNSKSLDPLPHNSAPPDHHQIHKTDTQHHRYHIRNKGHILVKNFKPQVSRIHETQTNHTSQTSPTSPHDSPTKTIHNPNHDRTENLTFTNNCCTSHSHVGHHLVRKEVGHRSMCTTKLM
jgi:hypothetical protein